MEGIYYRIYVTGDKTDCTNCTGFSLLSTTYKILSNIFISRLTPYVDEIIGDPTFYILYSPNTGEKVWAHWDITATI